MTLRRSRPLFSILALALLGGCAGTPPRGNDAVFAVPNASPPPYASPVPESYVIQRAPVYDAPVEAPLYLPDRLFEVAAAENARREAEARRLAFAQLQQRVQQVQQAPPPRPVLTIVDDSAGREAAARAEARAQAAEAEAVSLAAELAQARQAVAEAETAALLAESEAQRAVRERVAELAVEREQARAQSVARTSLPVADRANPTVAPRSVLGNFVTRSPSTTDVADASPVARQAPARPVPASRPPLSRLPASQPPAPRPIVERAPIPGLKPYILARSAIPSAKPRRAPPSRSFDIGTPSVLSAPGFVSVAPGGMSIPREPGGNLSTRFFPTPGKPSTLGTDRDSQLDLVSIDAVPYGIGAEVSEAVDGGEATAEWTDAVALIENGEVEALAIMEDADLVLTLCSGRSILTTPPDLAAAATLTAPQIICGQNKPLALR